MKVLKKLRVSSRKLKKIEKIKEKHKIFLISDSFDKIITTLLSCETKEQFEVVNLMFNNFIRLYSKDISTEDVINMVNFYNTEKEYKLHKLQYEWV